MDTFARRIGAAADAGLITRERAEHLIAKRARIASGEPERPFLSIDSLGWARRRPVSGRVVA